MSACNLLKPLFTYKLRQFFVNSTESVFSVLLDENCLIFTIVLISILLPYAIDCIIARHLFKREKFQINVLLIFYNDYFD